MANQVLAEGSPSVPIACATQRCGFGLWRRDRYGDPLTKLGAGNSRYVDTMWDIIFPVFPLWG